MSESQDRVLVPVQEDVAGIPPDQDPRTHFIYGMVQRSIPYFIVGEGNTYRAGICLPAYETLVDSCTVVLTEEEVKAAQDAFRERLGGLAREFQIHTHWLPLIQHVRRELQRCLRGLLQGRFLLPRHPRPAEVLAREAAMVNLALSICESVRESMAVRSPLETFQGVCEAPREKI